MRARTSDVLFCVGDAEVFDALEDEVVSLLQEVLQGPRLQAAGGHEAVVLCEESCDSAVDLGVDRGLVCWGRLQVSDLQSQCWV